MGSDSIVAMYWVEPEVFGDPIVYEPILPIQIKLTPNKITLIFDANDLPEEPTDGTSITGDLINEDTFLATGPGFARRRRTG